MRFANPAAWWLALLTIPVVLLHVLRPRRRARTVSSTYLWQEVATPVAAASPWQRLRPSTLLLLQLLAVLLLAGAAARPVRLTEAGLATHTVFIVDTSGSMAAVDGSPDRVAAAVDRARQLRTRLPVGGVASVVEASSRPRVLLSASPDGGEFGDALGRLSATAGGSDFATAFTLAESLETPGQPIGFVFLSDGGLADADRRLLPPGIRYERIGERSNNRALTRLVVEPRGSGLLARVTVRNTGGPAARQEIRLDVDGHTVRRFTVQLGRGETVDRAVEVRSGDRVEAFLEGEDLLAADDHVRAVAGRRRAVRVLVAGADDLYLDRLLAAIPGVVVERSPISKPAAGFDLAVYDGVAVPADPGAPFLAINPTGGSPGVTVTGAVEQPAVTLVQSDDTLLADLDLADVGIATAQRITPSAGDDVLVGSESTPLLVRGERNGRPFAYLGFALGQSNLPVQVAFPVLGDRLVAELAGAALPPGGIEVGELLPLTSAAGAVIEGPGATRQQVPAGGSAPVADRPGFWVVTETGRPARTVAVNPDPGESTLAPASSLPIEVRAGTAADRTPRGERSLLAWLVAALLVVLILEALIGRRSMGVGRRQARLAWVARALIVALLVGAVLGISLPRTRNRVATIFLLDASDSMGASGRAAGAEWIRDALDHQPGGALGGVALFGGDARLQLTVQEQATLLTPTVRVDGDRTNLAGALRLAGAVLPADARRRVVIVSDGRATEGDAEEEARRLREEGVRVDVHTVARQGGPDAAVTSLRTPTLARRGESIVLRATISATQAGPARLTLTADGTVVEERTIDLHVGDNEVELTQPAGSGALQRFQLQVAMSGDGVAQNDVAHAAVRIEGPARVLLVEGAAGEGATLATALRAGGIDTVVVAATAVPPLDDLATYTGSVLVDVDRRALAPKAVADLTVATRDLGRGLVTLGGDRSYALGGYLDSDLEQLLPVVSDVLDPKRRSSVAEVLAIDTSGSMAACHCADGGNGLTNGGNMGGRLPGGVRKTDIARAAAARTIEALSASDEVGVLAFNSEQKWMVDLQQLPSEEVIRHGLDRLAPAGGTDLRLPLRTAAKALRTSKAKLKHVILFTDGFTATGALDDLAAQAAQLRKEGITVSVLATGEGSADQLRSVAEAGGGRFYPGRDLEQIPQIMMEEAVLAARDFVNEGRFLPEVVGNGPAVDGLRSSPPILGYLATTAKPSARTLLRVGEDHDPLLVTWQAGLGRVTSWTSDASARWSQAWAGWDGYVPFWSAAVKDTFPTGSGDGAVQARVESDRLLVQVDGANPWPEGAVAVGRVAGPDGESREVRLERVSATGFSADMPAGGSGSYAVGVQVRSATGSTLLAGSAVASQSYSAEYRLGGADPEALAEVAALSGGRAEIASDQAFDRAGLVPGRGRIPLAGWLLVAAALLWPVAVALSRLALTGSVAAVRRATPGVRRRLPTLPRRPGRPERAAPPPPPSPSTPSSPTPPATVGRLLDRKRAGRSEGP